jgi:hypothetical protein
MSRRLRTLAAFSAVAALAAAGGCDQGTRIVGVVGGNAASVRFVNATSSPLDLTADGRAFTTGGHLPAGTSSVCLPVRTDVSIGIRLVGAPSDVPGFAPVFVAGQGHTVIIFAGGTGTTQTVTLSDEFTPTSGLSGLRVFDAAPGTGSLDVFVTAPGDPLTAPSTASIGFGGGTPFFDVNPGTSQVRFTVATTPVLAFDAGQIVLTAGARATLVLTPAAAGASTPTVMLLPAC